MPSPLTVMGFDYGTRRIGIAIGNTLSCTAQALVVIARDNEDVRFAEIESLLKEWMPNLLVVGVPTHPDGAEHEMTAKAKRFGNQLSGRFKLPVEWVDERYSSVVLEGDPEMRDNLDAHSATLLLEQYFAERSLTGN
ncbi:Holliday junction resolvase RuvX [Polynucleobacter paneuropaeus]|nr:Holliday junction resolvase RuvX [Polynucleobacter paneuropaeus]MBT8616660.1 Holliday junction resolvase RuvX [Polynucleobacter paneuropaeus]MBT8618541.1 Holliday junction resolvase RuvX [Polynucleobacter paneuropaeus]MBT8620823.1 Holliday junction resolvase RuvX [Polynucleobacter paneuropaeus]MBT8625957.1 Holliday junction resolvase RuvX [Polynucleobacter paneuropaeus]